MRTKLIAILLGLATCIPWLHAVELPEQVRTRAEFLAAHPALGRIKAPGAIPPLQARNLPGAELKAETPKKAGIIKAAALPHGLCNVVSSDAWGGRYTAYGVYSFSPSADFTLQALKTDGTKTMVGNGGGVQIGNRYYLQYWYANMGYVASWLTVWDTDTWEMISQTETDDGGLQATDLAYDRLNNVCYGAVFRDNLSGWEIAKLDFEKDVPTKRTIGSLPMMAVALAVDSKGNLFGILEDGVLYKIDKSNANLTRIGDTGIKLGNHAGVTQQSGTIDQHTDVFWWAAYDIYGNSKLYTVNTTDGSVTEIADIPDNAGMLNMQILAPSASDKAPNYLSNLTAVYPGGRTDGTVSFTVPDDTYDGTPMSGELNYTIRVNHADKVAGKTTPGATVSESVTVSPGMTLFEVWVENAAGRSPVESAEIWIGDDIPVMKSVNYTADGRNSTISWAINETGEHGGWLGEMKYDVTRFPDNVNVAERISATSVTDVIPADAPLAKYSYFVTPVNGTRVGQPMESNSNIVGSALEPPYFQPFTDASAFDTMVVLNLNKDKQSWKWSEQNMFNDNGLALLDSGDGEYGIDMDDWLLTPILKLEAGNTYTLSFKALTTAIEDDFRLEVCYGPGTDVSKYKNIMDPLKMNFSNVLNDYQATFTSDRDQEVRVGFHLKTDYFQSNVKIDDIRVSAKANDASPAKCDNVAVEAGENGALKAIVKITAPSKDRKGNAISSLEKINIYCDNDLVKVVENPTPGAEIRETVDIASNGVHAFNVEAYNEHGSSEGVRVSQFIGVDIPGTFKATLLDNGDCLVVNWESCLVGANGYYVDTDKIVYDVYQVAGSAAALLAQDLNTNTLTIPINTDEGQMGLVQLAVRARNIAGESKYMRTNTMIIGEPYKLPYEDHFDGKSGYVYSGDTDQMFDIMEGLSSDDDDSCFAWMIVGSKVPELTLETLKIKIAGENPVISFDTSIMGSGSLRVSVITPDGDIKPLTNVNAPATTEWNGVKANLSEYASERYVRIKFDFIAGGTDVGFVAIDNLIVNDVIDHDLSVEEIILPAGAVKYNDNVSIGVKVAGRGAETADRYTVSLYADNALVGTKEAGDLAYMKSNTLLFDLELALSLPSRLELRAVVDYDKDEVSGNNSRTAILPIEAPKVSAPENLAGSNSERGMELTWETPSLFYKEHVIDSFETYSPWTISNLGEWELWDMDGAKVIRLGEAEYPNQGVPQAFTVFNPSSIGVPEANTEAVPHSGQQYLVSFAASIMQVPSNDDWLVSPLLPGTEQTIGFYAKQMITSYGPERVQVLYSDNKREVEDFKLVEEFTIDNNRQWKAFKANLPEGAKYFAIRVVTSDGHMCMIDDVDFTAGSCTEINSWNVYRNNQFLANVPASTTSYVDTECPELYKYNVTAVYATGQESAFSNDVTNCSSVDEIFAAPITYDVFSVDGRVIRLNAPDIEDLDPGVYVINGKKVVVTK